MSGFFSVGGGVLAALKAQLNSTAAGMGAALVAFAHSVNGAVGRFIIDKLRETVSIEDFGAVGDGVTDDTAAFTKARAWAVAAGRPVEIVFTRPKYLISASPNWAIRYLKLTTVGKVEIACTGSGPVMNLDGHALGPSIAVYGMEVGDFLLTGTATTDKIFYSTNVVHSKFGNITAREGLNVGFHIGWGVCNTYASLACSVNQTPMTHVPGRGMKLTSSNGLATTACTFDNVIMEGNLIGIDLNEADGNVFKGGTAEACTAHGVIVNALSKFNRLIGMSFEANTTTDVLDQGKQTTIEGGYSTKLLNLVTATQPRVIGVRAQSVVIDVSTIGATVEDVSISSFGAGGGFADAGTGTSKRNIYNANTAQFNTGQVIGYNPASAMAAIAVPASGVAYTNATTFEQLVLIRNGTVTQILFTRAAANTVVGGGGTNMPVYGIFKLLPGDKLTISYSVAPDMIAIPQ